MKGFRLDDTGICCVPVEEREGRERNWIDGSSVCVFVRMCLCERNRKYKRGCVSPFLRVRRFCVLFYVYCVSLSPSLFDRLAFCFHSLILLSVTCLLLASLSGDFLALLRRTTFCYPCNHRLHALLIVQRITQRGESERACAEAGKCNGWSWRCCVGEGGVNGQSRSFPLLSLFFRRHVAHYH